MSSSVSETGIAIDAIDFQVPCRRFTIKANVTRDRQRPVVDEFVLRLVRIAETITVPRLAGFFGFSEFEIEAVILPMIDRGLIQVEDDKIVLAQNGQDLFKDIPEGDLPRITVVESWTEGIWFELISKNMMRLDRFRPVPSLLQLPESPDARRIPERFAADAFEQNFHDYALRIRRHPDADNLAIYSVSGVEPGTYGYQLLPAEFRLDPSADLDAKLEMPLLADDPVKFARLGMAAADIWNTVTGPETSASGLDDYERLTGDQGLSKLRLDTEEAQNWIDAIEEGNRQQSTRFWGAVYLDHNIDRLCRMIARSPTGQEGKATPPILWLRPSGTAWGRTVKVSDAVQRIRQALASIAVRDAPSTLIVPRGVGGASRKQLRKLFDAGRLAPASFLPGDVEILLVPGVVAVVALHLRVGRHTAAAGVLTDDPQVLRRLERRFNYPGQIVGDSLWEPRVEE